MSSTQKLVRKLNEFQANSEFHPLTCPQDSTILHAEEMGGKAVMVCPQCYAVQANIPKSVLDLISG